MRKPAFFLQLVFRRGYTVNRAVNIIVKDFLSRYSEIPKGGSDFTWHRTDARSAAGIVKPSCLKRIVSY